jgi:N-acyl-D-amino-acid deacylase
MKEEGRGVFQLLNDFHEGDAVDEEFALMRQIAAESGRPLSYTLHQKAANPEGWRDLLAKTADANEAGAVMRAQVIGRPTGVMLGFELTAHPFVGCPSFQSVAKLPFAERIAALRDPELRAKLLSEDPVNPRDPGVGIGRAFGRMFELGAVPNYEPDPATSLAARAKASGVTPQEIAYDLLLRDEGRNILFVAAQDYEYGDLEVTRAMMEDPNSILGLGDGGAHCGIVCDASFPTHMLAYWARDRVRGPKLPLPWVVNALTLKPAEAMDMLDRGQLKAGLIADINIIDADKVQLFRPTVA